MFGRLWEGRSVMFDIWNSAGKRGDGLGPYLRIRKLSSLVATSSISVSHYHPEDRVMPCRL